MIDEEHLSQEEEKDDLLVCGDPTTNTNTNTKTTEEDNYDENDDQEVTLIDDEGLLGNWLKVQNTRRKQHIELKDLTEENFLQLTESKNQDQRFYSWLHFQPLFQDIEPEDPVAVAHRLILD